MSDTVIRVENLGKRYRIGLREQAPKTLRQAMTGLVGAPFKYLQTVLREPTPEEVIWALKDVSFEVKQGEVVGLIGRNGAGKSTLLKILSQITEPTCGYAEIRGRVGSLLEVGTGFHPDLTGRENTYLNGTILGMTKREIDRYFDEIVAFAEVEKFIDTPVKFYSSGMYTRLAFAVAAHLQPEILIVDEVLAVGDVEFQKKCLGKMGDVATEGRTVLFVSHNTATITALCKQAIWLSQGRVEMQGDINQIISKYLSQGTEHLGEVVFRNHDSNQPFGFKKVSLLNSCEKVTSLFDAKDSIRIRIEYYASQFIPGLEVSLLVKTSTGIPIFSTNRSSSLSPGITAGNHISELEIPALFLVPGLYSIDIGAHIPKVKSLSVYESLLTFEIEETGTNMASYKGTSYGVVFVNLQWKNLTYFSEYEEPTTL